MARDIGSSADGLEIVIHEGQEGITMRLCGRLNVDSSPALRDPESDDLW